MQRHQRYSVGGTYSPSFLSIELNSFEDFKLILSEKLSDGAEAAFLHEYIHLLQDLTTTSGLTNIGIVVDYMKWVTNLTKQGTIKVPRLPGNDDGYNLHANAFFRKIAVGSGADKNIKVTSIESIYAAYNSIIVNDIWKKLPLTVIMEFRDQNGDKHEYRVGEHAISESMAYLIESCDYPGEQGSLMDIPYRIVSLFCEHLIPGSTDDPLRIIALCDSCMLHQLPGKTMLKALEQLKDKFLQMSPEAIYDYVVGDDFFHLAVPGITGSLMDFLKAIHLTAKQQMINYFTTHQYQNMIKWTVQMFDDALELRLTNPYFMIDIARSGQILSNAPFQKAVSAIGCPIIMNLNNEMTYIRSNKSNFDVNSPTFSAISQIYSIFKKGNLGHYDSYRCKLIEFCKRDFAITGKSDLTAEDDSKCYYAPWKRTSPQELQQCHFGQMWFTWGLKDVEPVTT